MKKSISLVEVMVSIILLSVVIVSSLQIKQNNLHNLERFKDISKYDGYINLTANSVEDKADKNIYLSDVVDFDDDEIRREFKDIKIELKHTVLDEIELPKNDFIKSAQITKSRYSIQDNIEKNFYTFKLQ
ncbi:MAG: hypothetical protein U9Q33_03220 [Campylobacterota bacterium]|nr:hypothetical protein [Campylobacterota bacterium]